MLDLTLTTLYLEAGQERRDLPGLYAAAPKKAARLRAADRLILMLSQTSASPAPNYAPLPPNLQQELLARLAETYYTSTGSVTAGMKAMAERMNDFLISRNLRQSRQQSAQVVGMLNMVVVHGAYLYIAQSGPVHAYLINGAKVEHFTDAGGPSRGLGLARLVNPRFFQAQVEPGASLLLSLEPPKGWQEEGLTAAASLDLGEMRAALISRELELEAALVRFSAGRGEVRLALPAVKTPPAAETRPAPAPAPAAAAPAASAAGQGIYLSGKTLGESVPAVSVQPAEELDLPADEGEEADEPAVENVVEEPAVEDEPPALDLPPWMETAGPLPDSASAPAGSAEETQRISAAEPQPPAPAEPARLSGAERARARRQAAEAAALESADSVPANAAPQSGEPRTGEPRTGAQPEQEPRAVPSRARAAERRQPRETSAGAAAAARAATGLIGGLRRAGAWVGGAINRLVARALPDQPAEGMRLSASTMLFIALAVPVLVVAISATVYFQRGRGQVHAAAVATAQQFADRAANQGDTALQREDWNQAMDWLDRAAKYGSSDEAVRLRRQAQAGLDTLDGLSRLEFRPALSGTLGEGSVITRMLSVVNDVYMLDKGQGRVLRLYRSGQGYELDRGFVCSPGEYAGGTTTVGPLVDITTLPGKFTLNAIVLGIDAQGNILLCQPNELPFAQTLLPPDTNWGSITRAVHLGGVLYVLDAQANQVYRYFFSEGEDTFVGKPTLYFDLQVPRLGDVVDMATDQEYLYLLHADGSMTSCNNTGATTQCDDPAPYGDSREGRASDPLRFEDAAFALIQSTQPPDASLYVLDTLGPSIYNFSHRRLNLQRLYRPYTDAGYPPAGKPPQAFVVTPNRRALLAVDNNLYMATLP